jgi:hypothetical protein
MIPEPEESMIINWIKAYESYNWSVDLSKFREAKKYQNGFNTVVTPKKLIEFETFFERESTIPVVIHISEPEKYAIGKMPKHSKAVIR